MPTEPILVGVVTGLASAVACRFLVIRQVRQAQRTADLAAEHMTQAKRSLSEAFDVLDSKLISEIGHISSRVDALESGKDSQPSRPSKGKSKRQKKGQAVKQQTVGKKPSARHSAPSSPNRVASTDHGFHGAGLSSIGCGGSSSSSSSPSSSCDSGGM